MKQVDMLLQYLKEHGSITGMDCITELGIMNYKGRICDIRQLGFPVKTTMETVYNRTGEKRLIARYHLMADIPNPDASEALS